MSRGGVHPSKCKYTGMLRELCDCSRCKERQFRRSSGSGSTMYGRSRGSSKEPTSAQGHFDVRSEQGHSTQVYDDKTRLSWDADGRTDHDPHWTNQNTRKGRDGRHDPPPHTK